MAMFINIIDTITLRVYIIMLLHYDYQDDYMTTQDDLRTTRSITLTIVTLLPSSLNSS